LAASSIKADTCPGEIFFLVEEVPVEAGHMLRLGPVAGEHADDVAQRLRDLGDQIVGLEARLGIPADLPGDRDRSTPSRHPVGISGGLGPAFRL
jgi:hypothetical protein